ncbi:MAG: hypothetical protein WKI46_03750 [Aquificaceae bacterium]
MKEFILFLLGLNLALGFVRIFKGPSVVDSMLASLLLGTGGTSLILVLYKFTGQAFLLNLALGFALLAGVVGVAFAIIMLRDAD